MLGILCEKPSAARNFAKALGGMKGTFSGTPYAIAASRGHLYEFRKPPDQVPESLKDEYGKWRLETLPWDETDFSWEKELKPGAAEVLKGIKEVLSGCDEIAIATDDDPTGEGELLAWEILDGLKLRPRKWSRFYFTDEAPASIQKAFRERKEIKSMLEDGDYRKAQYRSQWDFMSMQFTRIASVLTRQMLRQGRLKSAMVRITGEGLDAVASYKKIPFYQWRFRDENGNVYSCKDEPTYPKKEDLRPEYGPSPVIVDSTEEKHTPPPRLVDLSGLASMLAPMGYKAAEILETYQKMYEDQIVSYPRTEDKVISREQFQELLPLAGRIAALAGVDPKLLTHRAPRPTHVKDGGAHGANRPGPSVPDSMEGLKKYGPSAPYIYLALAKSFLAMLCEDYTYMHQEGHLEKYPGFKGHANIPKSLGYRVVWDDGKEKKDDEEAETGKALGKEASPFIYEGFPKRPPTPTMKWLMKQLEKRDVGTGATRTSTYADVSNGRDKNALIKDTKGRITLTDPGRMSYMLLPGTHIGSLDITEKVYADMRDIEAGKADGMELLKNVRQLVLDDIGTMKANMQKVQKAFPGAGRSADKEKRTGIYRPTGQEVSFSALFSGHEFTDEEAQALLEGAEITFEATSRAGKPYTASGKLAEQEYKGKKYWGFMLNEREPQPPDDTKAEGCYAPKKKTIRFKREFSGHRFTDDEVAELLKGHEITFEATSRAGKPYTAKGKLKEQTYNGVKYWGFKPEFENAGSGGSRKGRRQQ